MLVLGLSNMRDAAAALVSDGRIVAAAEEERFVRQKHVTALPVHAITSRLNSAGARSYSASVWIFSLGSSMRTRMKTSGLRGVAVPPATTTL